MSPAEDQRRLTAALGRVASGLFILSARRGDLETGMLTSWVQQCSFEPPQVSVAVKRGRWLADWLTDGAGFALNVLDDTQTDMIVHFGRGFNQGEPAFRGVPIDRSAEGNPTSIHARKMPVGSRTSIGGSSAEESPPLLKAIPSSYDRQ